jgi:hypothetical protein
MSASKSTDRKQQRPAAARRKSAPRYATQDFSKEEVRRRFMCDYFHFWFGCPHGICKRQHRCAGDPFACFERFWWLVPERLKVEFRTYVKARTAGASHDAAWEAAEKEVVRQAPWIAAIDAEVRAKIAAREAELTQRHGE